MVREVLDLESKRHTERFSKDVQAAFGIDLRAVVRQEDLGGYLDDAAARNTSLIKSLSQDTVKRIEQAVLAAKLDGRSARDLRKELQKQFGIVSRRADLIAQDQMAKLTADLNERRQQQVGVKEYDWLTSHDERVRPLHKSLDGTRYQWGKPTGAEDGLPPGKPIRCRCVAIGVVEFGDSKKSSVRSAGATPAAEEPKTVALSETTTDEEARDYVLERGRKDGNEHLVIFEKETRRAITRRTSGQAAHVGLDDAAQAAIYGKGPGVVAHHNHPSGRSLSGPDLQILTGANNLQELWAHGHNGATYSGGYTGKLLRPKLYQRRRAALKKRFLGLISEGKITAADADATFGHFLNKELARLGYLRYEYDFPEDLAAIEQKVAKWLGD